MNDKKLRVGFIGAGYIASWHANALAESGAAQLVGVCDPNLKAAQGLARTWGATAYRDLNAMLDQENLDVVHVLSPPSLHCSQTLTALSRGCHAFVEKPFALQPEEAKAMLDASATANRLVAVNHNFLALPAYQRLKDAIESGSIGKINRLEVRWHFPLAPLRSGPYGLWMLRSPSNLLYEIGPHLFAFVQDLLGPLSNVHVQTSKSIDIPALGPRPQNFSIWGQSGQTDVQLSISLVEGIEDRSLTVYGISGQARVDFGADTFVLTKGNSNDIILSPLVLACSTGFQYLGQGLRNAWTQARTLNKKSPYALSMMGAVDLFYQAVCDGRPLDRRLTGDSAASVIGSIASAASQLTERADQPLPLHGDARPDTPMARQTVVVIGGTGFIGRALTRRLVAVGYRVRVFSRGGNSPFADLGDAVEIYPVDLLDRAVMAKGMADASAVYDLAKAEGRSWEDYLENDVKVTAQIAEAAIEAHVKRFIYTGTIASYNASNASQVIDEATPFGPMESRQLYGRSKAACEQLLLDACATRGLPLVIARPGIVIGAGGPLQHWGIGRWNGSSAVKLWGQGNNHLPLVLIDDVVDGLVRMLTQGGIVGESFNLVANPSLSARGYFDSIHKLTGVKITADPGSLAFMFAVEWVKYLLKRFVLRKQNISRPSWADCQSRAHLSPFSNQKSKEKLGWQPEEDPVRMMQRAVLHPQFFGY